MASTGSSSSAATSDAPTASGALVVGVVSYQDGETIASVATAVRDGLDHLLDGRGDKLVVYQAYRLCPSSSQLPVFYDEAIRGVPGVKDVLPVKVVVSNCRASLDTIVFRGVDPDRLTQARPDLEFVAGDWAAFHARADAALVGRRLAERRDLRVGQPLTAAGITVQIAGVFASDAAGEENAVYTHLPLLLNTGRVAEEFHVTQFEVTVADPQQAVAVAAAIDAKVKDRFQVPTETKPPSLVRLSLICNQRPSPSCTSNVLPSCTIP